MGDCNHIYRERASISRNWKKKPNGRGSFVALCVEMLWCDPHNQLALVILQSLGGVTFLFYTIMAQL